MERYPIAKLVSWAGELNSRKRLQKVVYLLQAAGCPLGADFVLHHYGPYSFDVAQTVDEMARMNLLAETTTQTGAGEQYSYALSPGVGARLAEVERSPHGATLAAALTPFEGLARELLDEELWRLEYAATIAFFRRGAADWPAAVEKAVAFKKTSRVREAEALARRIEA